MLKDLPIQNRHDEMERDAYNAAFYELGFRWHWDRDTYETLLRKDANPSVRVRHYLETHQAHLLRAYDAAFLVDMIQTKKAEFRKRPDSGAMAQGSFDWSQMLGAELGA
ncbi:MAG TPA: hypothetical protein VGP22_00870 [Albitalea sp.]|nr:hypothetical protein [Albitalea sp.]